MLEKNINTKQEDIAIIGISARFPNAATYNEFWQNIRNGKSCISEIPDNRWNWKKYYKIDGRIKNRTVSRWGGFIDDMSTFDYAFFGISKREADNMDPQQRLLIEESWSCFEDAGVCPSELSGKKVGVFVAGCNNDFRDLLERNDETILPHQLTGSAGYVMANRLSYIYDLKGPSIQIDTACSGSLSAINYGVDSLLHGECEMALVGACNVMISPDNYVRYSKLFVLSPTGKIRTFDKDADGYVRGEGVSLVLLKPLQKAIDNGDRIYGVIKGISVNHCGHTQSFTYPSEEGEASVIQDAIRKADISITDIQYLELHGTGTVKGDPIEFAGVKSAFADIAKEQNLKEDELKCALGSVKTNIGHLENAAGMAGLIKVLLGMKHGEIPQTINFSNLNPEIQIENTPFHLVTTKEKWEKGKNSLRNAGISSFGLGGTNAHMIVQEYVEENKENNTSKYWFVFVLSAKTEEALQKRISDLKDYLDEQKDYISLEDLSYTLMCGREHMKYRMAFVANSVEEVYEKLKDSNSLQNKEIQETELSEVFEKIISYKKDKKDREYRELLEKLASAYINGAELSWKKIYNNRCKKLNLPTYSFADTECWVPQCGAINGILPYEEQQNRNLENGDQSEMLFYREIWETQPISQEKRNVHGTVIVLLPWEYRNHEFKQGNSDISFLYIEEASCYQSVSDNRIRIEIDKENDYKKSFGEFNQKYKNIIGVIDLLALGSTLKNDLYYPAYIIKAIAHNKMNDLDIISGALFKDMREKAIFESRIGYERTLSVVMRRVKLRFLLKEWKNDGLDCFFNTVFEEFTTNDVCSVLYEDDVRKKLKIQEMNLSNNIEEPIKDGGIYIITGGAGGLGKMFAKHLLTKYHAKLVLTGRSNIQKKQDVIDELSFGGNTVTYIEANVANHQDMLYVVKKTKELYGRIDGVIYAAGNENETNILVKQKDDFNNIISPKVDGVTILDEVLEGENVDFICYFSSTSAVLGDFGSCDYSIGNRFLQAYANYSDCTNEASLKCAINWPLWENGGMAMNNKDAERLLLTASGQNYMRDEEGVQAFERILASGNKNVLVMSGKKEKIDRAFDSVYTGRAVEKKKEYVVNEVIQKDNEVIQTVNENTISIEKELLNDLMKVSAEILEIEADNFRYNTNFADIGYDSINLRTFAEALSSKYDIDLTMDVFFGYPTFKKLSDFLIEEYNDILIKFYKSLEYSFNKSEDNLSVIQEKQYNEVIETLNENTISIEKELLNDLMKVSSEILEIEADNFRYNTNFADIGYDSINLRTFAEALSSKYDIDLTMDVFFGYPTFKKLSDFLIEEYNDILIKFYKSLENIVNKKTDNLSVIQEKQYNENNLQNDSDDSIAIVGMSGIFPCAENVQELWDILYNNKEVISEIPESRIHFDEGEKHNKVGRAWRMGMVKNPAKFDPLFFDISPIEAEEIDPRQRLLLEEIWKALEDAGMNERKLDNGSIGIFLGAEDGDYRMMVDPNARLTSNHNGIMASRLAYILNFSGPCIAINTACSSSLTAFHQAYLSIKNGDCDAAVVAGVNLIHKKETYMSMAHAGMLSDDSRCYAFDSKATGMVPSEAVAVIVLKKLSQAKKDHNYIYGVVAASGINYDGKTSGITAPSGVAQKKMYQDVFRKSGIDPKDVSYVLTHGTGTKIGDPIEIKALQQALNSYNVDAYNCAITSVKPNIGHSLAASGLVSVISLLLAMKEEIIPASINCDKKNEYVRWENAPMYINQKNKVWCDEGDKRRIGGVSSFGMSGTNVHVLIKSYPNQIDKSKAQQCYLMVLSAKTKDALERKKSDMKRYLIENEDVDLTSISYTLLEGRYHFEYRFATVITNKQEFISCLESDTANSITSNVENNFIELDKDLCAIQKIYALVKETMDFSAYKKLLLDLEKYYCMGYEIDGNEFLEQFDPNIIQLPTYPFDNKEYWYEKIATDMLLVPEWKKTEVYYKNIEKSTLVICDEPYVAGLYSGLFMDATKMICSNDESVAQIVEKLRRAGEFNRVVWIQSDLDARKNSKNILSMEYQAANICSVYRVVKALIEVYGTENALELIGVTRMGQIVNKNTQINPDSAGVHGFFGVLAKEIPNWSILALDVENTNIIEDSKMMQLVYKTGTVVALRDGVWYHRVMVNKKSSIETYNYSGVYRQNGVYVVLGGAGDVGSLWTEHIVRNYHAQVIWIGRRALNQEILEKINLIGEYGPKPEYYSSNILDLASLQSVRDSILKKYGQINGVVVSTVADFDRGIRVMNDEEFKKIVEVKAMGCMNVERIFGDETIDFILNFSSSSAIEMPLGQAGYTAGCCFADAYAHCVANQRKHRSKTINWGFWGELGAGKTMPESIKSRIYMTGTRPLEPFCAFYMLDKFLCTDWVQAEYLNETNPIEEDIVEEIQEEDVLQYDTLDEKEICKKFVVEILCSVLKISEKILDVRERFEKYGIDSITILSLISAFRKTLPEIESTVFYECQTIQDLIDYVIDNHVDELKEIKGCSKEATGVITESSNNENQSVIEKTNIAEIQDEDIAIIGMSGRFAKAKNLDEFWDNLVQGRDCISEIPTSRWSLDGFYEPDVEKAIKEKKSYCNCGGFIDDFADFDPRFFKISPREAVTMDPQERTLLEESYKALENAAYPPSRIKNEGNLNVGVFVGVTRTGFELHNQRLWDRGEEYKLNTSFSEMANRISYTFNFKGPSFAVDTMCSSSLTALHVACENIRRKNCDMALVGSSNIYTHPATYRTFCEMRMLSKKGKCHAFGKDADGFVPGEGVVAIVLKPLSKAREDNDMILGVIKATSINHGGRTNGFTVPNPIAQKEMIRNALDRFNINARHISYVEAHGTGTELGDPIEISGLTKAYREDTKEKQYCAIGSVKSNIGHCEAAAGLAGVIKVLLQMQNKLLVPSLYSKELNPLIDFKNSPFYVQQELQEWKRPKVMEDGFIKECPRIAAVSAFGAGGSNAHVIIEEGNY
ncbi:MAG: SDR family NAD(P)-dependent oxidoreductase [Acutalibacteraceae bacterium]|nr:SDR family NAD(P)-dependent oxidoreductase [Acutalibacteraceae bacterium]